MKNMIHCSVHGERQEAFVCTHLAESLKTNKPVGFFYSGTVEEHSDAWCLACEEVRLKEGGEFGDWNEKSEAFAQITLICEDCYTRIVRINEPSLLAEN